ncbi:hypothetical protein [Oryzihumus leptocrescens]|uniref:hypothetical protein n=1 Tax=Oryzihumus leptocrescens TaxID=297536 RepID=UPI00114EBE42|nr:hypothetical protein [Oryzihumus leptocrescens]
MSLPHHVEEATVVQLAADRGLAVDGLSHFEAPGVTRPPALVVGYGTPPRHGYSGALARLTATLEGV